jgi:hypothetical protein
MLTKTVRSRFDHQIGEAVEGCKILERRVVIPPDPVEKRRGVYDYLVEVPPAPEKPQRAARKSSTTTSSSSASSRSAPQESFTRATPEEMGGGLIRRLPSR